MEILELINNGSRQLKNKNIYSHKLDSEILLSKVLNKYRPKIMYTSHELYANINMNLENDYRFLIKNLPKSLFFFRVCLHKRIY